MYLSRGTKRCLRKLLVGGLVGVTVTVVLCLWWPYVVGLTAMVMAAWAVFPWGPDDVE